MRRVLVLILLAAAGIAVPAAGGAIGSPTVRLAILHFFRGCHVWSTTNAPSAKVTVKFSTRIEIRATCPMDFDLTQTAGPRLNVGGRLYAGRTRTLVFPKRGTYKIRATNVQTSEQQGLQTLGPDNSMVLTVVVR